DAMASQGVEVISCTHWAHGGAGAEALARAVVKRIDSHEAEYKPLYPLDLKLADKIRTIAQQIYRASDISVSDAVARRLKGFEDAGFGNVPVCIAKTQYSFTSDPTVMGAPTGHTLPVREVRLSAGAGFVVAICGDILTMPGLPRAPSAEGIHLREDGEIEGLS
ncbi:MAG TPA: formate--tetrahydrofolate ligase, partial [Acetobacteraceae bacterium]|nr:formate--tetrahydrofolate ligase [Acetobacteraceae bacterium]